MANIADSYGTGSTSVASTSVNWGQFYSQGSMPQATPPPTYTPTQQTQGVAQPRQTNYTPTQQTQGLAQQPQSNATPTEQRAAGQDVIQPYEDLQTWFNPFAAGGYGTPTELRSGGGYGPSAVQWSEQANNLALMQKGVSPPVMAEDAVKTTYAFLTDFGVRPDYITPYVVSRLGLTPQDLVAMGYAQDPYGRWILLDFGDQSANDTASGSGSVGRATYGGGGGGRGAGSSFRSGYTSGLINWRIGL